MRFLLSIYVDEAFEAARSEADGKTIMDAYWAYDDMLAAQGALIVGEALADSRQAKGVRVRNGSTLTTDGPFSETKEQLGGFYLVEVTDETEALALAAACPSVVEGSGRVEVRQVRIPEGM